MTVYHGRWDTWLITKGLMDEYFYLMMKSDQSVSKLLETAKNNAAKIENSPLKKVLIENN